MDTLISFGSEVKAHEDGTVDGHLVIFGEPDVSHMRDVFTKNKTDYDINPDGDRSTVFYDHGLDPVLKRRKLGKSKAEIGVDDVGVWIKTQLDLRNEYEAAIHQLAQAGKLGWSSGVPSHLVDRKSIEDNAHLVTFWPLGKDASLTVRPADFRNVASVKSIADLESMSLEDAIKSLLTATQPEAQSPEAATAAVSAVDVSADHTTSSTAFVNIDNENKHTGVQVMAEQETLPVVDASAGQNNEIKAVHDKIDAFSAQLNQVLKFMEDAPPIRQSGYYTVDGGEADPEIKSAGDLLLAIARKDTKRLTDVYNVEVKAQTERDGTTGGFYVPESTLQAVMPGLSLTSGLGELITRIPVSTPSGSIPIRDYTRAVTANVGDSASASGIASQGRQEGGAYTEETMYFEKVRWEVTDTTSGYVKASRELVNDVPMIESILRIGIREDVANKEEHFLLRGNGAGQPLGVLNWPGTIGLAEDTDNTFAVGDMDEMVSRHLVSNGKKVAWAYFPGTYTSVAGLERGTGGAVMHDIQGALPAMLSGYPQFKSQHLPAQGTNGYVVLGDWSQFFMFEYGGLYIEMSEHADFLNGNIVWRFGKREDGRPIMTSAVTLADGSFTVSPFVKLNNLS